MTCHPTTTNLRAAALMAFAALSALCTYAPAHAQAETFKIGIISPMSGPNARYGAFANKGAALAAKEINAAGGVLGKPIVLLAEDDRGDASEAASAVSKLITRDHVVALIGEQASSRTLAASAPSVVSLPAVTVSGRRAEAFTVAASRHSLRVPTVHATCVESAALRRGQQT